MRMEHFKASGRFMRAMALAVVVPLSVAVFTVTTYRVNALIDTFYITCNFMDILIATDYLCLGLLQ